MVDGKRGSDSSVDGSNFNWANRIHLGYSADFKKTSFVGKIKNFVYKSTSASASVNIDSAAEYVNSKMKGKNLVINDAVDIDDI
jgi:hypothetical protein